MMSRIAMEYFRAMAVERGTLMALRRKKRAIGEAHQGNSRKSNSKDLTLRCFAADQG